MENLRLLLILTLHEMRAHTTGVIAHFADGHLQVVVVVGLNALGQDHRLIIDHGATVVGVVQRASTRNLLQLAGTAAG